MKRKTLFFLTMMLLVFLFVSHNVFAVAPGKTVEFADGTQGKVTFNGSTHAEKDLKCKDCHPAIFPMKKATEPLKMADMNAGKFCGVCHNGKKAFSTSTTADCEKCHKK